MGLLGTNHDLYKEAADAGRLTEDLNMKVDYSDIFISPWCCDSSHEDRYEKLISKIYSHSHSPSYSLSYSLIYSLSHSLSFSLS